MLKGSWGDMEQKVRHGTDNQSAVEVEICLTCYIKSAETDNLFWFVRASAMTREDLATLSTTSASW
eukprot:1053022-Amphidinium_carterae.1